MGPFNSFGGLQIVWDVGHTETQTYSTAFPAHPIIRWLAKFLPITPSITIHVVKEVPRKDLIMLSGSRAIAHPAMKRALVEAMSGSPL